MCKTCLPLISHTECTSCHDGYWLDFLNGKLCQSCLAVCRKCVDGVSCSECNAGRYLDNKLPAATFLCELCLPECSQCTALNVCTHCKGTNKLHPDASCKQCDTSNKWRVTNDNLRCE